MLPEKADVADAKKPRVVRSISIVWLLHALLLETCLRRARQEEERTSLDSLIPVASVGVAIPWLFSVGSA